VEVEFAVQFDQEDADESTNRLPLRKKQERLTVDE
jgi:hypothetical protein